MTERADLARIQQEFARRQRAARRRHRLPWIVAGLALALAGFAAWALLMSSWLAVADVRVVGVRGVTAGEVTEVAAVRPGRPMARVDLEAVARRVETIPAVADARVTRSWPDRIVIRVTERVAVVAVESGTAYELVDASGVMFRTVPARPGGLPPAQVSGPRRDVSVRSVAAVAALLPDSLRTQVTSVSAGSPDAITLRLTGGRRVIWGSADDGGRKLAVLTALMRRRADVYDVSAPDLPVTKGESR